VKIFNAVVKNAACDDGKRRVRRRPFPRAAMGIVAGDVFRHRVGRGEKKEGVSV